MTVIKPNWDNLDIDNIVVCPEMEDTPGDYSKVLRLFHHAQTLAHRKSSFSPFQDVMDDQDYDDITAEVHAEAGLSPYCAVL